MFNHNSNMARAGGFVANPFGTSNDEPFFSIGDGNQPTTSSTSLQDRHDIMPGATTLDMDWMSHASDHQFSHAGFSNLHNDPGDLMDFDDMDCQPQQSCSSSNNNNGVRGLVAQFENSKSFIPPPLPPRPINNNISTSIDTNSSLSSNFGSFNPIGHDHNHHVSSPVASPTDSVYGSFSSRYSRVTSPFDSNQMGHSSSFLSFNSFHSMNPMHSPGIGSSLSPLGTLSDFIQPQTQRMSRSHMDTTTTTITPMSPPPPPPPPPAAAPSSQPTSRPQMTFGSSGTPGFEIWRPPGTTSPKAEQQQQQQQQQQIPTPAARPQTNSAGSIKPPVPTKPKPIMNVGSQFVLDFKTNPSSSSSISKAKAPVKVPRLQMPPPPPPPPRPIIPPEPQIKIEPCLEPSLPSPEIKREMLTPLPATLPSPLATRHGSISLRPQGGTRPSREQVPAEAWEQYKTIIRSLYLEQRKPLKEVMSVMADKYGFQATPKMYKTRFSQWGFVKNNTEDEVKRLLSMKFQRDAEGKVSEFVRNGRIVNIGTYLKRKGVTEYDLVDFELPANLPEYIRCRTPTPPLASAFMRSPELVRAQELVLLNIRKQFMQSHNDDAQRKSKTPWSTMQVWGAWSSEMLVEANFFLEAGDSDNGGQSMMRAFKQLEEDLKTLSPLGIVELLLGMVNRDLGLITALCKYLAAYSSTNLDKAHPLRLTFCCLYDVQQRHGSATVSELLHGTISTIAEDLEALYGRRHPYVARTWVDLALFYNHINTDRLEKLILELQVVLRDYEQQHGRQDPDGLTLRYTILQLLSVASPRSEATKRAAEEIWAILRGMNVVFPMRDSRPNAYCYHSPVRIDPWSKRCRRRYESGVSILEEHVGVKIHPYFEEDFHTTQHALESQDAWANALQQQQDGPPRWNYIF